MNKAKKSWWCRLHIHKWKPMPSSKQLIECVDCGLQAATFEPHWFPPRGLNRWFPCRKLKK